MVDAAALLDVMQGYAPGDPYHLPSPSQPFVDEVGADPGRLRVGLLDRVPWALPDADVADAVSSTAARLASLGHVVEPVRVAIPSDVPERFTRVWAASLAANPIPHDLLEPHNRAFAAAGEAMSAPALLRDFTSLQLLARSVVAAFEAHDVVLAPVTTRTALRVGELGGLSHAGMLAEIASWIGICPLVNVTGQPAISLPVHRDGAGVPVGVQLIGHPADEATLVHLDHRKRRVKRFAKFVANVLDSLVTALCDDAKYTRLLNRWQMYITTSVPIDRWQPEIQFLETALTAKEVVMWGARLFVGQP